MRELPYGSGKQSYLTHSLKAALPEAGILGLRPCYA